MRWIKNVRFSLRALNRSRLRALLSVSGVAVGIAAVVILIGAGVGADRALQKSLERLGENLLAVNAGRVATDALRGSARMHETLTLDDWEQIKQLPSVKRAAPVAEGGGMVKAGARAQSFTIIGTTPEFREAKKFDLIAGRFIDQDDIELRRRVAVVGAQVTEDMFYGEWAVGQTLLIGNHPFTIIGLLKRKGMNPDGTTDDGHIIVPVTTVQRRMQNTDYLERIFVQARSKQDLPTAKSQIADLLRSEHSIGRPSYSDDFEIQEQTALLATQKKMSGAFSNLTLGLAALALTLGGVGLLAVSLLSVRERYAEIGLRIAVGAQPRDILIQFLVEAALLALLGGVVGICIGATGILVAGQITGWTLAFTWEAVAYPFLISLGIAIIFGALPASRAARLDPILALRAAR